MTPEKLSDLDLAGNSFPKCPYCGYDDRDFETDNREVQYDGDETSHDCPKCDKKYHVTLSVSFSYTTEGKK